MLYMNSLILEVGGWGCRCRSIPSGSVCDAVDKQTGVEAHGNGLEGGEVFARVWSGLAHLFNGSCLSSL
jgi:hypothetical protein